MTIILFKFALSCMNDHIALMFFKVPPNVGPLMKTLGQYGHSYTPSKFEWYIQRLHYVKYSQYSNMSWFYNIQQAFNYKTRSVSSGNQRYIITLIRQLVCSVCRHLMLWPIPRRSPRRRARSDFAQLQPASSHNCANGCKVVDYFSRHQLQVQL